LIGSLDAAVVVAAVPVPAADDALSSLLSPHAASVALNAVATATAAAVLQSELLTGSS